MREHPVESGDVDAAAVARLGAVISPHETVEWAACADARAARKPSARLVVLGLFWLAVSGAAFWGFGTTLLDAEYDGLAHGLRLLFLAAAASPFAAVGAFLIYGHVPLRARAAGRTAFALTSRRLLAVSPLMTVLGPARLRELDLARVGHVEVEPYDVERPDDFATLEIHDASGVEPPLRLGPVHDAAAVAARIEALRPGAAS